MKSWKAPLTKDTYIGVGVPSDYIGHPDGSGIHSGVTVVGNWHGVTLSFGRKDESDHLNIYLAPEDARAIGKQLTKMAAHVDAIHVMERIKGKEG